jgi:hypothetical protein
MVIVARDVVAHLGAYHEAGPVNRPGRQHWLAAPVPGGRLSRFPPPISVAPQGWRLGRETGRVGAQRQKPLRGSDDAVRSMTRSLRRR